MYTAQFWKDATERAVKTAAQAVILFLGADVALDAVSADWPSAASFALGGAVLSYLTSIVSAPMGDKGTASVVHSE
jgi:hypothetical protein